MLYFEVALCFFYIKPYLCTYAYISLMHKTLNEMGVVSKRGRTFTQKNYGGPSMPIYPD